LIDCPHAARCGGCSLISLTDEAQHVFKRERVLRAFSAYGALAETQLTDLVTAESNTRYRTRAKLVVSATGEIGLYGRGSHDVIDIPQCQVLAPRLSEVVAALRELLAGREAGQPVARAVAAVGDREETARNSDASRARSVPISGVDLREVRDGADIGVLVTLIGPPRARTAINALARQVAGLPNVVGVAFSARDSDSAQVLGTSPVPLHGVALARDRLDDAGPYVYAAHGGFAQAHRGQATKLVGHVLDRLSSALGSISGKRVLELYAGAGALALRLSQQGARVTAVERYAPALAQLSRAAQEQSLPAPECLAEDTEAALDRFVQAEARFDAIVVNPPRRGLPPRVRAQIAQLAPRAVVYVSCDPDTLARDLADFANQGLRARELTPYDLMPLAADVESVAWLEPGPPPTAAVLYEDDDVLVVDKPPHLPTHPEREHASSLLIQLQRAHDQPELRAVHRLDLGTSGVCVFAKTQASTTAYAAALAAGQKHYLALARGRVHDKGNIKQPLADGGTLREALTRYTRKQFVGGHSLLRVRPAQGRTHQVRRHLASIGHPVLGDARYGDDPSNRHFEHRHGLDRTFLHLSRVELQAPSGETLRFEAPLAADLETVLRSLREG
jgi:23S rRNA (uracil1939-C5)-methyltransferase